MHKTNKSKAEKLAREVCRRDAKIETLQKENAALLQRALDAERAGRLLSTSLLRLNIRFGLAYGEDVMDEDRGKSIGKRVTLPALADEEADELLRKWQSKAMKDDKGNVVIAVGLRDDPDDHKTDAELAEETANHQEQEADHD